MISKVFLLLFWKTRWAFRQASKSNIHHFILFFLSFFLAVLCSLWNFSSLTNLGPQQRVLAAGCCCLVAESCLILTRHLCHSPSSGVCSDSCPLSHWTAREFPQCIFSNLPIKICFKYENFHFSSHVFPLSTGLRAMILCLLFQH